MSGGNNGAVAGAGAVYGLGFFGAVIYYIRLPQASSAA
jgi:hypothetical protein